MGDQAMAATRDELADAALKNYEDNVKAAWPDGSSLSTIPQAIEVWRTLPQLEQRIEELEEALIKCGAWLDEPAASWPTEADALQAWEISQEVQRALAQQEEA